MLAPLLNDLAAIMQSELKKSFVVRLDGQQIIARKRNFGYVPEIEEQRRFLAQIVDLLIKKEQAVLAKNGGDLQAIRFPEEDSQIDAGLGILTDMLMELEDVDFILKDPSFIKHMEQLNSFNWKFYHEEVYPYIYWKKRNFDDE